MTPTILFVIENADATPPHLNVFLRFGSSVDMLGLWSSFATGSSGLGVWSWTLVAVLTYFWCLEGTFGVFWGSFGACGGVFGRPWRLPRSLAGTSCEV